ncbi:ribonuclease P protein component domain protein [Anaeroglobus geminatus F0357]|uniref:Ribonuclease P protein component domain protein n=2 Tax=Anaeroglobus TaxID=156454 RepID=G9YEG9_9FIRM|nr:ribonuclease P protein component domain protein [Anaeroglobus geminatus F0357]
MKEVYRLHKAELSDGYDLVLIGRSRLKNGRYADAERAILNLFEQAGILRKK